jgi:hypothetical protein
MCSDLATARPVQRRRNAIIPNIQQPRTTIPHTRLDIHQAKASTTGIPKKDSHGRRAILWAAQRNRCGELLLFKELPNRIARWPHIRVNALDGVVHQTCSSSARIRR